MSFESDLAAYMKQVGIQAEVKQHIKKHGGFGGAADEAAVLAYANEAVDAIIASLPPVLAASIMERDKRPLFVGVPYINEDGDYQVNLTWNEKAVWRESLYDDGVGNGYPDGLENIVALFSHGSKKSKGMAAGLWKPTGASDYRSVFIPAGSWRQPDSFLKDAVEAYNHTHAKDGVKLIMPDEYYPNRY